MCLLTGTLFYLFYLSWDSVSHESLQRRLWPLARMLADEMAPNLNPVTNERELMRVVREATFLNPSIDVYLLDSQGTILNRFGNGLLGRLEGNISPEIFKPLLESSTPKYFPIYGPDPVDAKRRSVFSVAELNLSGNVYYVYVILWNSYAESLNYKALIPVAWRATSLSSFVILIVVIILAKILISSTFAPFKEIMASVEKFQSQNFSERAPANAPGELGQLSAALNSMAEQISRHISELNEKDNRRMELISNIWHDVRAPLTGISSLAQLLQRSGKGRSAEVDDETLIASLLASTNLLAQIVNDLQELGELEVGDIRPKPRRLSLASIADEIALVFGRRASERRVELKLEIPDNLPDVFADEAMIARAMSNLLENSLRYTTSGGRILLELFAKNDAVVFAIEDNGSGIAPEDLPHIFERRFQSNTPETSHGVSGLGLSIVKKIVECHKGSIEVSSVQGASTRFEISFPSAG